MCINNIPQHISTHCQWLVIAQYDVIKVSDGSTSKQIFTFLETTVTVEVKNLEPHVRSARNQFQGTAAQLQADVLSANIERLPDQEIVKHNPLSKCRNRCSSPIQPMTTSSPRQFLKTIYINCNSLLRIYILATFPV